MWGFFLKPWGFSKKSGDYFKKCGDFWGKNWWGQVGIFDSRGGDFNPKLSGNTENQKQGSLEEIESNYFICSNFNLNNLKVEWQNNKSIFNFELKLGLNKHHFRIERRTAWKWTTWNNIKWQTQVVFGTLERWNYEPGNIESCRFLKMDPIEIFRMFWL